MKKNNKGTVLVDMDGVLSNFDCRVIEIIDKERPELHPCLSPGVEHFRQYPRRKNFHIADDYPDHKEYVSSILDRPGFFKSLEPFDDAIVGWQRIINLGYTPQICSAPLKTNPNCIEEKLEWLEEHFVPKFGRYVVETAILNGHKADYDAVALIDDKPKFKDSNTASWTHIIRTREYNKNVLTDFRLDNWSYGNQLGNLLKKAHKLYVNLGKTAI